jgi:hypothetical protein
MWGLERRILSSKCEDGDARGYFAIRLGLLVVTQMTLWNAREATFPYHI